MEYFVIGESELVTAFKFIGVDGQAVNNMDEALDIFLKITRGYNRAARTALPGENAAWENCRVLIITEEAADWLGSALSDWQLGGEYPLVVEIPGIMGRLPGRKTLVDSIREAIGVHV
jgi:V/A-type H+-transporting ATPase subunit F